MIKTDEILLKKNRYEFSSAFIDQRLPNMVQRLFADVIHDAIWLMNIHEQKYPLFLAMVKIPLIGFNPPHFCACPKPGPGFSTFYVGVLFMLNEFR